MLLFLYNLIRWFNFHRGFVSRCRLDLSHAVLCKTFRFLYKFLIQVVWVSFLGHNFSFFVVLQVHVTKNVSWFVRFWLATTAFVITFLNYFLIHACTDLRMLLINYVLLIVFARAKDELRLTPLSPKAYSRLDITFIRLRILHRLSNNGRFNELLLDILIVMLALFVEVSLLELWCTLDRRWVFFGLLLVRTLKEKVCHHRATTSVHSHHVPAHLNLLLPVHLSVLAATWRFHFNWMLPLLQLPDYDQSMNWLYHFRPMLYCWCWTIEIKLLLMKSLEYILSHGVLGLQNLQNGELLGDYSRKKKILSV